MFTYKDSILVSDKQANALCELLNLHKYGGLKENECYFIHELMYVSDYRIEYKARKYKNKFIIKRRFKMKKEIKKVSLKSLHELVDYKKKVHENIKEIEKKYNDLLHIKENMTSGLSIRDSIPVRKSEKYIELKNEIETLGKKIRLEALKEKAIEKEVEHLAGLKVLESIAVNCELLQGVPVHFKKFLDVVNQSLENEYNKEYNCYQGFLALSVYKQDYLSPSFMARMRFNSFDVYPPMDWNREKDVYYIEFDSNQKFSNALTIKEIEKQAKSLQKDVEKINAYRNKLTEKENELYKKYTSYVFEKALEKGAI